MVMNYKKLKERAEAEAMDNLFNKEYEKLRRAYFNIIQGNSKTTTKDMLVPYIIAKKLEEACDGNGIPCYYTGQSNYDTTTLTIGKTYSDLLSRERRRQW
jgi:hypothetical protein